MRPTTQPNLRKQKELDWLLGAVLGARLDEHRDIAGRSETPLECVWAEQLCDWFPSDLALDLVECPLSRVLLHELAPWSASLPAVRTDSTPQALVLGVVGTAKAVAIHDESWLGVVKDAKVGRSEAAGVHLLVQPLGQLPHPRLWVLV